MLLDRFSRQLKVGWRKDPSFFLILPSRMYAVDIFVKVEQNVFRGSRKSGSKKQEMFYVAWYLFGYMFGDSDCKSVVYADSCLFSNDPRFQKNLSR